jgi:primosomal protein N' (replication factor Y)
MFYLVKVLIGRAVVSLDRPFDYWTDDDTIHKGMRVLVSFGPSKETTGFVLEEPTKETISLEEYQKTNDIHLAKIIKKIDSEPLLDDNLFKLAYEVSNYYKADLIKVLASFLPPSLKPKDSALKKPQAKTIPFVKILPLNASLVLSKKERDLYQKIQASKDGIRKSQITAKASYNSLLSKKAIEVEEVPVSRIPELLTKEMKDFDLTKEQQQVYDEVLSSKNKTFLLQGVTGSGKTEVYIRLAEKYLQESKGVLVLIPEIALTDQLANLFASYFKDTISILNSSLSDARKYDEYQRIVSGETRIVLGTRSAIFAPIRNLGLIIIDEEHSSTYKQDTVPFYDADQVALMRSKIEDCKVLLGSATPRIIDKARALKGIYEPLYLKTRFAKNQDKDLTIVNMNNPENYVPQVSSLLSKPLIEEIKTTLAKHEQVMILINRRGYSPLYVCRKCHKTAVCPNCDIPLNYHKRSETLRCHHCGYEIPVQEYTCDCKSHDFLSLGYGTERVYEELKMLFPTSKITRLDSDVSSNDVRHEILQSVSLGETDILVGTEVIAKGHDFPLVTLASIINAESSLNLPTYLANEETFDLISQFVGRAGRGEKKGRVLIQTTVSDNQVIQLAAKQDYESFYSFEMEERRKYQYPPYTFLTRIIIKAIDRKKADDVANLVRKYLDEKVGDKRFNIYGPSAPYIPHMNGRYYRNILLKYKSFEEASPILDGLKVIRLANKDVEISINVDPGNESI